ncbi:MAG: hypothetical protein GXY14_05490 [Spirochaetes bacterium]|nr:hypothetical protein [Spirochaetota bacterium]
MDKILPLFYKLEKIKSIKDEIIDLTRPMDSSLQIYSQPGYTDPAFKITDWCTIEKTGFSVSQVILGTQTGTHIDAPAHFIKGGATMESFLKRDLMGKYFLMNMDSSSFNESVISNYSDESFLFIKSCRSKAEVSHKFFEQLLSLNAKVWVVAGECGIIDEQKFGFNRAVASAGKFLVEDLEIAAAERITAEGYIFVMPLKLAETSGAPCRVAVLQAE